MGMLDYCQHGAITMTCPACKGRAVLPAAPAPAAPAPAPAQWNPTQLSPQEAQHVIPEEGELPSMKIDLGDVIERATDRVVASTQRWTQYNQPPA